MSLTWKAPMIIKGPLQWKPRVVIPPNPDFVSVWDTTQAGSASDTVVLPLLSGGTYSGTIDWGDGSTSPLSYANRQHTYASGGTYTITINGNLIQGFSFGNGGDKLKLLDVINCGNLALTTASAFSGCSNLTWTATDSPIILSNTLQQTFRNCTNFNGYINDWDLSSVVNIGAMFFGCTNFNQPLDKWDLSNCTSITSTNNGLFQGCTNFNQNINSWDVSGINTLNNCFAGCTNFNQPLDNWDVSNVNSMYVTFASCTNFNQNINSWDVSNVTDMRAMFRSATSFNQPLDNWDVSNVRLFGSTSFQGMFSYASSFNQDISMWNTSAAIEMIQMFAYATDFNQDLSGWDVSNNGRFGRMFQGTSMNQNLGSWEINSTLYNYMFASSAMSTENYTDTIVGWANRVFTTGGPLNANMSVQSGMTFDTSRSGGANFADAGAARTYLTTTAGWTIAGDTVI